MTREGFICKGMAVFVACGMFCILMVSIVVVAPLLLLTMPFWKDCDPVYRRGEV